MALVGCLLYWSPAKKSIIEGSFYLTFIIHASISVYGIYCLRLEPLLPLPPILNSWENSVCCAVFLHFSHCYWSASHHPPNEMPQFKSTDERMCAHAVNRAKVSRGRRLKIYVVFYLVPCSMLHYIIHDSAARWVSVAQGNRVSHTLQTHLWPFNYWRCFDNREDE